MEESGRLAAATDTELGDGGGLGGGCGCGARGEGAHVRRGGEEVRGQDLASGGQRGDCAPGVSRGRQRQGVGGGGGGTLFSHRADLRVDGLDRALCFAHRRRGTGGAHRGLADGVGDSWPRSWADNVSALRAGVTGLARYFFHSLLLEPVCEIHDTDFCFAPHAL